MGNRDKLPFELKIEIEDTCLEELDDGEEVVNERIIDLDQGRGVYDISFDFSKGVESKSSYLRIRLNREMLERFLAEITC